MAAVAAHHGIWPHALSIMHAPASSTKTSTDVYCSPSQCTRPSSVAGALLNTAHLSAAAAAAGRQPSTFILTANHCRSFDTEADAGGRYMAVFRHQAAACTPRPSLSVAGSAAIASAGAGPRRSMRRLLARLKGRALLSSDSTAEGTAPAAAVPPSALPGLPAAASHGGSIMALRGLHVAWQDEASDVLLLRMDSAIPAGRWVLAPGCWVLLGWVPPAGQCCLGGCMSMRHKEWHAQRLLLRMDSSLPCGRWVLTPAIVGGGS